MLVFDIADGSTWTDGINSSPSGWDGIESSEASLFSIEESSVVRMKWYDGKNSKVYTIELHCILKLLAHLQLFQLVVTFQLTVLFSMLKKDRQVTLHT